MAIAELTAPGVTSAPAEVVGVGTVTSDATVTAEMLTWNAGWMTWTTGGATVTAARFDPVPGVSAGIVTSGGLTVMAAMLLPVASAGLG